MDNRSFETYNEQHTCDGHQEGDWIIFTCPICQDYERRVNWKTSEMNIHRGSSSACHYGSKAPLTMPLQTFSIN